MYPFAVSRVKRVVELVVFMAVCDGAHC